MFKISEENCLIRVENRLTSLEGRMTGIEKLLENQANILKYVVTPLIIIIGALAGVQLAT